MRKTIIRNFAITSFIAIFAIGCGGGGSGSNTTSNTTALTQEDRAYIANFEENVTLIDADFSADDFNSSLAILFDDENLTSNTDYMNAWYSYLADIETMSVFSTDNTTVFDAEDIAPEISSIQKTALIPNNYKESAKFGLLLAPTLGGLKPGLVFAAENYTISDTDLNTQTVEGQTFKTQYKSKGENYNLSMAVIYPRSPNKIINAPIVVWSHGTTMEKDLVPSKAAINMHSVTTNLQNDENAACDAFKYAKFVDKLARGKACLESKALNSPLLISGLAMAQKNRQMMLEVIGANVLASKGYIVVMPDYVGQGADGANRLHPYMGYDLTARAVTSAADAAIKLFSNSAIGAKWNGTIYLTGYSEGGYSVLAAAKYIEQQRKDLLSNLQEGGALPGGGPYDLNVMKDIFTGTTPYPKPAYSAYMLYSYASIYNNDFGVNSAVIDGNSGFRNNLTSAITVGTLGGDDISKIIINQIGKNSPMKSMLQTSFVDQLTNNSSSQSNIILRNSLTTNWTNTSVPLNFMHCRNDNLVGIANYNNIKGQLNAKKIANINDVIMDCLDPSAVGGAHTGGYPSYLLSTKNIIWKNSGRL